MPGDGPWLNDLRTLLIFGYAMSLILAVMLWSRFGEDSSLLCKQHRKPLKDCIRLHDKEE